MLFAILFIYNVGGVSFSKNKVEALVNFLLGRMMMVEAAPLPLNFYSVGDWKAGFIGAAMCYLIRLGWVDGLPGGRVLSRRKRRRKKC